MRNTSTQGNQILTSHNTHYLHGDLISMKYNGASQTNFKIHVNEGLYEAQLKSFLDVKRVCEASKCNLPQLTEKEAQACRERKPVTFVARAYNLFRYKIDW